MRASPPRPFFSRDGPDPRQVAGGSAAFPKITDGKKLPVFPKTSFRK